MGGNMKFTKHQKAIITGIFKGDIFDIVSYLKYFNLRKLIQFDKEKIFNSFHTDELPKKYYCNNSLQLKFSNIMTEIDYKTKIENGEIRPEHYSCHTLTLSYTSGIKHETWEGNEYHLDFYDGVYIANCFDDILEFLTLWQFLLSEMLILEVPHDCSAETLGLFYIKSPNNDMKSLSINERIRCIRFENFSYDDQYYLQDENYTLSKEHCFMCKEYMNKKIYPSAKLGIFIQKRFTTYTENTQHKTLFVAYLTIIVSIVLAIAPHFQKKKSQDIQSITETLVDIKSSINKKDSLEELSSKLDIIINKLENFSNKSSSKNYRK